MKLSLFVTLFASLMVAFVSASAGDDIINKADLSKDVKKNILDEVKRDIDDCAKSEKHTSDFRDCVKDQLNDYDSNELKSKDKRAIKKATKDYDFKSSRGPRGPKNLRE